MNGNNGNDVFKAAGDGAVDNVNGGGGTDSCTCDAGDVKTSIP
jgi:hypothetical protein